jgi:GR25 family glycosyltransferase involved in LPS biosynthesis
MDSYIFVKGLDSVNGDVKRVNLSEPIPAELFNLPCFNTLGFFKNSINELVKSPYFKENDGLFVKNIVDDFPIKVVNLDRRPDRWEQSKKRLDEQGIKNYSRFSAIDGTKLEMSDNIKSLFRNNDFNYRQGFIGCALSHLKLWNDLIRDEENDYYIIMEDDFELVDDFKSKLNITLHQIIQKPYTDLHFLGYFYWNGEPKKSNAYPFMKTIDNKSYMGGFFGYIISKSAAFKLINISKYYGIQNGIDRFAHIHFDKMVVTHSEPHIVHSSYVVPGNSVDSDIQRNSSPVGVKSPDSIESKNEYKYKVKVMTDWCSSKAMIKHLSKMTENNSDKWKDMIITDSDEADYYVIINKPRIGEYYKPEKTILYQMEPWVYDESKNWGVKTWGKWSKPEEMKLYKVLTHKYHPNLGEWHINKTYSELMCSSFKKSKNISTFISEKNFDEGHIKRIEFMKFVESKETKDSLSVDIYGRSNHGFKNYKGPLEFKDEGLTPYKYTICVENNSENNYITEKLYDGILSECLCFYWGAPNVDEIIDSKAFIKLNLDNFEEAYETIKEAIENNEWEKRLKFIKKEKIKILNNLQILPSIYKAIKNE